MIKKLLPLSFFVLLCFNLKAQDSLLIVNYNLLNFDNDASGQAKVDSLKRILQYLEPDVLLAVEIKGEAAADLLLDNALNVGGITSYQRSAFVANQSNTFNNLQHLIFYNSDKLSLKSQSELITDLRDINVFEMYYNDPLLAQGNDTVFVEFYVTHLKAGTGTTNENRRDLEVSVLKDYLNTKPSNANRIFAGDFNLYGASEPAYQTLLNSGTYPFFDPINANGEWHDNASYAQIHTQCTRLDNIGDGGSTAGLDDRFDFTLVSEPIMNNSLFVRYLPDTYKAFGNSGTHFNNSILTGANTVVPDSVLTALYYSSDHLPVIMEIEITPPVLLPVELSYFKAEIRNDKPLLYWEAATELNLQEYQLEYSADAHNFKTKASFSPRGSNSLYQFIDTNPLQGLNYYRLKMIDADGSYRYSEIQSLLFELKSFSVNLQSNPVGQWLELEIYSPEEERFAFNLYNMTGQLIQQESVQTKQAVQQFNINIESLPAGIYFLQTQLESRGIPLQTHRFIKH